ncbi:EamA family transporter [Gammaproteobacteria bacterium]|nr:EamA family transporter [Gammaproteobacteria bacterium]
MSKHLIPYYFYIVGTVAFTVYGQIILKWRIAKYGQLPDSVSDKVIFLLRAVLDPYIFSGLVAAFIASLFWMAAMTKFDVSLAYPLITAGLTLTTVFMAFVILSEPVSINKVLGVVLIISGVLFMIRDA